MSKEGSEQPKQEHKRRWRDYRTASGGRPVKDFLMSLSSEDRAEVQAAMAEVVQLGMPADVVRHVRGDIYEVRASGRDNIYRVLFSTEGQYSQILLAVVAFPKKTRQTPQGQIELAERRLADWRNRARQDE